ncbi:hypothetical protein MRX96_022699 [Rhipicephalus microplus]
MAARPRRIASPAWITWAAGQQHTLRLARVLNPYPSGCGDSGAPLVRAVLAASPAKTVARCGALARHRSREAVSASLLDRAVSKEKLRVALTQGLCMIFRANTKSKHSRET